MFSLIYALKHINRSFIKCMSMIGTILIFVLLFCRFSSSIIEQEMKLSLIYETMPIYVEVSDVRGDEIYNLSITEGYYINTFVSEKYGLSEYIKDLSLRRTLRVKEIAGRYNIYEQNSRMINLIGITSPKEESDLKDVKIEYQEGFDYDMFAKLPIDDFTQKPPANCIVSEEFLEEYNFKVGDRMSLVLISEETVFAKKDVYHSPILDEVKERLTIVGVIKERGIHDIYCSWDTAALLGGQSDRSGMKFSNVLRATIKDNYKIKEFKEKAKEYYTPINANLNPSELKGYSLTVYDDIFMRTILQIQRNLQFVKAIYPLILAFSFAIGYLLSYLFTRNRKKEVAVMRSLGISRKIVFITIILELTIINIIGIIFGTIICKFMLDIKLSISAMMLFFVFNTLGATLSTLKISSGSVMAIMKDKE